MVEKIKITKAEFDDMYEITDDKPKEENKEDNANFTFEEIIDIEDAKVEEKFLEEH